MELTQEYLKSILKYCPETGAFIWRISRRGVRAGASAGCFNIKGYKVIGIGKPHYAHRLAFLYVLGRFPDQHVDHINHDKTDNRFANLREVSQASNNRNQPRHSTNTSGCTGVSFDRRRAKWLAQIIFNGTHEHLGRYTEWWDAVCARKSSESKHGFHVNHGR